MLAATGPLRPGEGLFARRLSAIRYLCLLVTCASPAQDALDRGWLRTSADIETSQPKLEAVLATGIEIASALSFLHAKDIVHGDLSAWNVMLGTSGPTAAIGGRNFVAKVGKEGGSITQQTRMY